MTIRTSGLPEVDSLSVITTVPPTQSLVDLDFMKNYLKIPKEVDTDNDLINRFIKIATESIEKRTRTSIRKRTLEAKFIGSQTWKRLPWPPVINVTQVETLDSDGTRTVTTDYQEQVNPNDYQIYVPVTYSSTYGRTLSGAVITYEAGYSKIDDVPGDLYEAVLFLVSEMYTHRDVYSEDLKTVGTSKVYDKIKNYIDPFTLI